jgi:hypothetical protein
VLDPDTEENRMSHCDDYPDPPERERLTELDWLLADLAGVYVQRRERGTPPQAHDLLAVAAEFGDDAAAKLRTVLALFEALIADEAAAPGGRRVNP